MCFCIHVCIKGYIWVVCVCLCVSGDWWWGGGGGEEANSILTTLRVGGKKLTAYFTAIKHRSGFSLKSAAPPPSLFVSPLLFISVFHFSRVSAFTCMYFLFLCISAVSLFSSSLCVNFSLTLHTFWHGDCWWLDLLHDFQLYDDGWGFFFFEHPPAHCTIQYMYIYLIDFDVV